MWLKLFKQELVYTLIFEELIVEALFLMFIAPL